MFLEKTIVDIAMYKWY